MRTLTNRCKICSRAFLVLAHGLCPECIPAKKEIAPPRRRASEDSQASKFVIQVF